MPSQENRPCPICKLDGQDVHIRDAGERLSLKCARCGNFTITRIAASIAERTDLGPKLSAWVRERTESGTDIPEINSNTLRDIEILLPTYKVSEKQLVLMRVFERHSRFPGQPLNIVPHLDYPLAWASGEEEFNYLLRSLMERNLINRTDGPESLDDSFAYAICISAHGWSFLEDHERPSIISNQAFVAMSFSSELKPAWEDGFYRGLKRAGYRPYRVDAEPHIDRIDTKIVTEIRNSRFLIADVTEQRPGVYFEAGYAIGLGLPVFWSVRKDDLDNVHFDTRQYNHIIWETKESLAKQIELFVTAVLGKGSAS
jgi:nucleoside 2-deoxyribosyltransferase